MKTDVLIINRHPHDILYDGDRCLVPVDDVDVHLVTHAWGGFDGLDPEVFSSTAVVDIRDEAQLELFCGWAIEEYGVRHVVALHEKAILLAARLRTRFGLPGLDLQTATLCRDKVPMKAAVAAAGVPVPEYAVVDSRADLRSADWRTGPKVVKSRFGVGGEGTAVFGTPEAAEAWWDATQPASGQYEIEEFLDGTMYHCDSVVEQGRVTFASVSEYLERPGDFGPGRMAGSLRLEDGSLAERILRVNERVIDALGIAGAVTHLELFHRADDTLTFLEIAARPGGGGIDRYQLRATGVHLFEAAIRVESGLPALPSHGVHVEPGAWGVVGFYPGRPSAGIDPAEFAGHGILEHLHRPATGNPRHCTDYTDRYVVSAPDRDSFLGLVDSIRVAYSAAAQPVPQPAKASAR